jgi:hypothetical protein
MPKFLIRTLIIIRFITLWYQHVHILMFMTVLGKIIIIFSTISIKLNRLMIEKSYLIISQSKIENLLLSLHRNFLLSEIINFYCHSDAH